MLAYGRLKYSGELLSLLAALLIFALLPKPVCAEGYHVLRQWGSRGTDPGEFRSPQALALDATGQVYVVDQENHRVQKFTPQGNFLATWGAYGTAPGQFCSPLSIALDAAGQVFVADEDTARIQVFTTNGAFLRQWGSPGDGPGQFYYEPDMGGGLSGLAVDHESHVYASDTYLHRVQKFTSQGKFLLQWGTKGEAPGQFHTPRSLAVDPEGHVYVADTFNYRIQKFTGAGKFVMQWGERGYNPGRLMGPWGVAVDRRGQVYVSDDNAYDFITGESEDFLSQLVQFTATGRFLTRWGAGHEGSDLFTMFAGLAVDAAGNVYVADSENDRVVVFAPDEAR